MYANSIPMLSILNYNYVIKVKPFIFVIKYLNIGNTTKHSALRSYEKICLKNYTVKTIYNNETSTVHDIITVVMYDILCF